MKRLTLVLSTILIELSVATIAHADIPVIDGSIETERSTRDSLTTQNRDVGKKTFEVSASVSCSVYRRGYREDPVSAANANPEITGLVKRIAQEEDVDQTQLLALIYQESRFNPCAQSNAGAIGLTQLMPDTAKELGVNPFDIEQNVRGGARYFKQQLKHYNNDINLALAAYNAGAGNVNKWGGIPPFKETQNYVANITEKWIPALGGSDIANIPVNYGGGTSAFSSARNATITAFAKSAAVTDSSGNVASWLLQLGSMQAGTLQDSWDQNSAARNANIEMFNQLTSAGITIAALINAQNTLTLSGASGSSESLKSETAGNDERMNICDQKQDLIWDETTKTCVTRIENPPNPALQLTPSN